MKYFQETEMKIINFNFKFKDSLHNKFEKSFNEEKKETDNACCQEIPFENLFETKNNNKIMIF